MSIGGMVFEESNGWSTRPLWQLRIPLAESQYINFVRDFDSQLDPLILSGFVNCVQRGLRRSVVAVDEPEVERMAPPVALVYAAGAVSNAANGRM